MLSKKLSDFIFIGAIFVILVVVVVARVLIFNQYDNRIETAENDITRLEQQIVQVSALVDENRNDQLPSMVEMYQKVPNQLNRNQLINYLLGMMQVSNIGDQVDQPRIVTLENQPASFPPEAIFSTVSTDLTPYRIHLNFAVESLDDLIDFIDNMNNSDQLFIIQSITYDYPESPGGVFPVEIYYIAYYDITIETE